MLVRADFLFLAFIFFVATGAMSRLGIDTPAWLLIYAAAGLFILQDLDDVADAARQCWPALLVPIIAALSTLWSESAGTSLYSAFQLSVTVIIALWVGRRFDIATIFFALWLGVGVGVLLSAANLAVGFIEAWQNGSLIGIYTQKNVFSKAVMLFFLGGAVTLTLAGQGLSFALLLGFCIVLIALGNSTSTFAFFAFTFAAFILAALGGGRPAHRVLNTGYVALVGLAALGFIVFGFPQVIDAVLAGFEKDSTLTGRTVLWQYAGQVIAERPWLGAGFNAFWDPEINGIVKLIRETVDERIRGFHNVYLEVRVATGMIGFAAFILFLATAFWASLKLFVFEGGLAVAAALTLTTLTMIIGAIENVMFRQHEVFQILIVALFAAASLRNGRRTGRIGARVPGEPLAARRETLSARAESREEDR
jgi:exopolysaccharide production protein ExoQ